MTWEYQFVSSWQPGNQSLTSGSPQRTQDVKLANEEFMQLST
jgi:hypothetical protein